MVCTDEACIACRWEVWTHTFVALIYSETGTYHNKLLSAALHMLKQIVKYLSQAIATRWVAIAWLARYVACAVNSNAINSTGLPHLVAASHLA